MLTHRQALEVIAAERGEQVVITTMASMGVWPMISDDPLDFAYIPSSMGHGVSLGLGLALARPSPGVILLMGDGSLLMNLGALVTVASHPAPLHVVLIDNGVYEVTGGQPTPGSRRTDFADLARAAGIERVFQFDALSDWQSHAAEALRGSDPSFIWLSVERQIGPLPPPPTRPMAEQIQRLRGALGLTSRTGSVR
jgi:thiamine pyrophosphate-dependent acetolactate synthase large subunit-like protein